MDNNRYRRYFIILDNEDEGFDDKKGKKPKGYTKIETKNGKGVLNHYIQNVKYFENAEYIYKGCLIGTKNGKNIYADNGTFIIDESGKGELNWKFDSENVDGRGNSIRDFNVIAIIAENTKEKSICAPLVGFIDKEKVAWRHILTNQHNKEEKTEALKEKVEIQEISKEIEEVETAHEEIGENLEENKVEEQDVEEKVEKEEVEISQGLKEESNKEYKEEKVEKAYRGEEKAQGDRKNSYDFKNPYQYYQQYFKMVCGYVENTLKYYKEIKPFEKNIGECKWWKIDCSHQTLYRNFLPFYGYLNNMYYQTPYMNYMTGGPHLIYKYQHYIFGIMRDKKEEPVYYLYGIPGRFIASEQPYEGMTGFVYWHPMEDKKSEKGDYGYWILHIDAKTGSVVIPLKPTIPPR